MPEQGKTKQAKGFNGRLFTALTDWEGRHHQRFSQRAIGKAVGEALGVKPIGQTTVSRWFTGEQVPGLEEIKALASVLEVDLMWLAFDDGDLPPAATAPADPMPRRKPTR